MLRISKWKTLTRLPSKSIEQVLGKVKELWMCKPSCVGLNPEDVMHERVMEDEAYVLVPFSPNI